jgi:cyclophilin family peptidyl-prolyl cis-trans isomerase
MPRKKQTVQTKRRHKVYREGEFSGEAAKIKRKGAFRFFTNYQLFAIIGVVALAGGVAISAFYTGGGQVRNEDGTVRGEEVIRTTPQPGQTPTTGATTNIKQYPNPPAMTIDASKTYHATINTAKGSFTIELLASDAPNTVNNFVFLANDGYYDGVSFHRVISDFVAQTGDPTGTGSGGPGYTLEIENADEPFTEGTVGMAKPADASSPNNGSQFFIALGDDTKLAALEGRNTVFGRVIDGLDVVKSLTERDPQAVKDAPPGDRIESITIEEA